LSDRANDTRAAGTFSGKTAWVRTKSAPVRAYLEAEAGSSIVLLAATIAALIWANAFTSSYISFWATEISVKVGSSGISEDLRHWINEGLMAFFFFVVGLEARREFDMGELRERRRITLPVLAGLGGMTVPVLIYLAFNLGGPGAHGWGAAMSTDTAFALGMLALVGPRCPERLRVFMLTVVVVDDVVALLVIAFAYTDNVSVPPLAIAIAIFALLLGVRAFGISNPLVYILLGIAGWIALYDSGIQPEIIGLAMGLVTGAYAATRVDLERATQLVRSFREQPTPELAREARLGVASAISPNERAQTLLHPWTSYGVVPIFALANAGVVIDRHLLERSIHSPITVGIFVAYVVGKPVGIVGTSWIAARASKGTLRPPVGFPALAAGGALAGIGFTVSLLIASLAFHGQALAEAKLGVLASAHASSPGRPSRSSILRRRSTPTSITCADPPMRPSRSSSTPTSSARSAARPSPLCATCSPSSAMTSATSIATCPCPTCTRARSSPPRPRRLPASRAGSGRCTTCCSHTRTRSGRPISWPTPMSWGSTPRSSSGR
jgi:Na+/H+ antiporter NhaA